MKRVVFMGALLFVLNMHAQTIQLPGTGTTDLQWSSTQLNASTQLHFSNPEYNVTAFTLTFPISSNPDYTASSTGNQFTQEMLANIPSMVNGSTMLLDVTLKAPGTGHESWHKSYQVHFN